MTLRCTQYLLGSILIAITSAAYSDEARYTTLDYGGGKHFPTGLYDAALLGQLPAVGKEPYLVFSGRSCVECDENQSVYIHSPSDGSMKGRGLDARSTYPGNYYAYDTGKLVARVRMFIGRCIDSAQEAAVWFVHEKVDNGSWRDKVFVSSVTNGQLDDAEATSPLPGIGVAEAAVARGLCREIPPIQKAHTEP
jgi:hypothetical protein